MIFLCKVFVCLLVLVGRLKRSLNLRVSFCFEIQGLFETDESEKIEENV